MALMLEEISWQLLLYNIVRNCMRLHGSTFYLIIPSEFRDQESKEGRDEYVRNVESHLADLNYEL